MIYHYLASFQGCIPPTMSANSDTFNQAEHEHISTSLEVEQLEVNLFRSKSLRLFARARGVFGGFVIQACLFLGAYSLPMQTGD